MADKLGFIFPGQGSQSLGMLKELANDYHIINETFSTASDILGYDLWAMIQEGPESELNQTENTQPALLASSVAIWRIWKHENGRMPDMVAGHSLGEYSALVAADSLDFEIAVRLVAERGRLMQAAVPEGEGAMAAVIGLEPEKLGDICKQVADGEVVSPANYNAPGQIVVSGHKNAVERVLQHAKDEGAKLVKLLPLSVPSHCVLMIPAATLFAQLLEQVHLRPPQIPVVHNVDVTCHTKPEDITRALVHQLYSPVQWVKSINYMIEQGIDNFIECGPGEVLQGLNKRINKSIQTLTVNTVESLHSALSLK